jgi:hypothetical protein
MGYLVGIVPKYLILYSVVKLIFDVNDYRKDRFKGLDQNFYNLEIAKFFVVSSRIIGMKYIRQAIQFNFTIISLIIEMLLFFYQKSYFSSFRFYAEIVFGTVSFIFLVFFHPIYCEKNKNK